MLSKIKGKCTIFFIIYSLLFCGISIHAQSGSVPFERISEMQGVPCPVRKIVQDSMGFIWLGTADGLAKYDGRKIKRFQSDRNDPSSLVNDIVNDLKVDRTNRIWVATNGGLCYYDYRVDRFFRIDLPDNIESLDLFRVHALHVDKQNRVWFSTKTKVHLLLDGGHSIQSFFVSNDPSIALKSVYADENDHLFIGTNQSTVYVLDLCTNHIQIMEVHSPVSKKIASTTTSRIIVPLAQDTILLGSWMGGLNLITTNPGLQSSILHFENKFSTDIRANIVTSLGIVEPDLWWVGTFGAGVFWFRPSTQKFVNQLKHDPENGFSLLDDYIQDILIAKDGIIWVASNNGLNRYDRSSHRFTTIDIPVLSDEKSVYRMPYQIHEDQSQADGKSFFITVPGLGLMKMHLEQGKIEHILRFGKNTSCELGQRVYELHEAGDSLFILLHHSILIYNRRTAQCRQLQIKEPCFFSSARKLIFDPRGYFWIATSSEGLFRISLDGNSCINFRYNSLSGDQSIQDNTIFCMLLDRKGNIWLGSQNSGLSMLNTVQNRFTYFKHSKKESNTLPDNSIFDLYEDRDGMIWIATENGLSRLDVKNFRFRTFTTHEGLPANHISSITADDKENLWLATSRGLCYFNQSDGSFRVFSQMDGLAGNRMEGASCLSKNGRVLFSTHSKISISNPTMLDRNKQTTEIYITNLQIYGKDVPLNRLNGQLIPVEINYRQNIFSVDFVAIDFTNNSRMNYAYKLEGLNDDWIYTGNRSEVHFTNLKGGEYVLRMKAANYDGQWFESKDRLILSVLPPFWKSQYFIISIFGIILAISIIYLRIKFLEARRIQQLRLRIARDLHDEVGSSISGIQLTSKMMLESSMDNPLREKFLERIQHASKSSMEMMSEIIWSLQPVNDSIEKLTDRMRLYASQFLEAAQIPFKFEVNGQFSGKAIPLDVRKDFLMVYKEILNNIAKHSKAGYCSILFSISQHKIVLEINDNGIGFDPTTAKLGNGLKNMKSRLDDLGAEFHLDTSIGNGTKIKISLSEKENG
ncbi:MAG: hypothetical protein IPM34_00250 [Saprospiraceae bacterium]|nr:hypothetical protein [Saprospiraceae bacterium]